MIASKQMFKYLEYMADKMPVNLYWLDLNQKIIDVSQGTLNDIGKDKSEVINKTLFDIYPKNIAEDLTKQFQETLTKKSEVKKERTIEGSKNRKTKFYSNNMVPVFDEYGNILGIMATFLDVTAEKELKRLKNETQVYKTQSKNYKAEAAAQEKFRKLVDQVSHDIRSPISTLLMVVNSTKASKEIPEDTRITIRNSAMRINDVANHLLTQYDDKEYGPEERIRCLISASLQQILTEKKYEYQKQKVTFKHNFNKSAIFAFVNTNPVAFKQMMSNLINNSVDAFDGKSGLVTTYLRASGGKVEITVEDNGKGMLPEVIDKIMNNEVVSSCKDSGRGIGLAQVRETLQENEGSMLIHSEVGVGTKVTLTFPKAESPAWISERIELSHDDLVVILDDDPTIHGAWQSKFKVEAPDVRLKHFDRGEEAMRFINGLPADKKDKLFLLIDYELLEQGLNGLNVIEQTQIDRSILVTSYADTKKVRTHATLTKTKVLPKILVSEVPIRVKPTNGVDTLAADFDMVLVDDDKFFVDAFCNNMFTHKKIASYQDPLSFLENVKDYPKNMIICLDNNYKNFDLTGLEVANILHGSGYTNLYMISGNDFADTSIPDYLKVILKTDIDSIEKIAKY